MKHLIETANPSGLAITEYDRLILNSATNDVIVKGGGVTYEYVDLGLSVKWAKCNVGAKTETEYGDYFMWGSTTPNTNTICDWEHAPFNGGASDYDSNYFNKVKDTVAPNNVLAREYDAASQIMGGVWRMPTNTEIQELIDNTTNEWTQVNGVNGMKFTASNGNSIFIPASGYRSDSSFYNQDSHACLWSSSLPSLSFDNAYYWDLRANDTEGTDGRCFGYTVRGVCE